MNRLRTRLIVVFLAATILPLIVTAWITQSLLEQSLNYTTTTELERLSWLLEETGRDYYSQARDMLRREAAAGTLEFLSYAESQRDEWPQPVVEFWESGEAERFTLSGAEGNRLDYLVRKPGEARLYSRALGAVHMDELQGQIRDARELVARANDRDLRRGLTSVLLILMAAVWIVSFMCLVYVANRLSRPIRQLTEGLSQLASGNLRTRLPTRRDDEVGRAIVAFNNMAGELEQSRERLVYLTQVASWQSLARKMAHELKNSLTPIRLTVEEIRAREPATDRRFMDEAVRIVVSEVESLERRVRAFSDFSSEPPVRLVPIDVNSLISERAGFLRQGHPGVLYALELSENLPLAVADIDRVKGIFTNLLENAAEAAGEGGRVTAVSRLAGGQIHVEVHDSGPGLSAEARRTLFEPAISFKEKGMGLGLSIARKDALVCSGDLSLIEGKLGGAGFRLTLPAESPDHRK